MPCALLACVLLACESEPPPPPRGAPPPAPTTPVDSELLLEPEYEITDPSTTPRWPSDGPGPRSPAERAALPAPPTVADGRSLVILGATIAPGSSRKLLWSAGQTLTGAETDTPVLVINGVADGPTLCLTAAIHGDELNGIEMVRRIMYDLEAEKLSGALIGIPIVNLHGFRRGSRYLPDRRDLNRYFPGNPNGSSASRIAYSFFQNVIRHCDALVDIHTGSLNRTNLPQLRADLRDEGVRRVTSGFGGMVVLQSAGTPGTLRRAATDAGIPGVTMEAGEPARLQSSQVNEGVAGIFKLLDSMKMVKRIHLLGDPEPVFYRSTWVRADYGGILFSVVRLGQVVDVGDILGTVTDPITNEQNLIYSPVRGRVLGMALNQVVMPGFATFNLGIQAEAPKDPELLAAMESPESPDDRRDLPPGEGREEGEPAEGATRGEVEERPE